MHKDRRTREQLISALTQAEATIAELIKEKQHLMVLLQTFQSGPSRRELPPADISARASESGTQLALQRKEPLSSDNPLVNSFQDWDILTKILDAVVDPIFIKDSKHRLVLVNQAESSLLGKPREELLGRTAYELFPEFFVETSRVTDDLALTTGLPQTCEEQAPDAEGRLQIWQTRKSLYVDSFGKKYIVCTSRDVTESRQAEEILRKRLLALTQPATDTAITFEALLDLEDLQRVQDAFSDLSGVASIITAPDGTPITEPSNFCRLCKDIIRKTEKGRANCFHSDAVIGEHNPGAPIKPCLSGGLWCAGASISVDGRHLANWLVGQVRTPEQDEEQLLEYAQTIGADREEFAQALREVPVMPKGRLEKIARALFMVANKLSQLAYHNLQQARLIYERDQRELRLRASLQEKESLLREVHHRVKNNLQIISSLLSLQSTKAIESWALDLFSESRDRIAAMALVHEELYGSSDFSRISLTKYLEKIVPRLTNPTGQPTGPAYTLHLENVELSIEKAVPFGLIVNELVTNAVKHGLKSCSQGELRVEACVDGNSLNLTVTDNGPGLPPGFDPASTGTLGMQLVLGLTRQLRGTFQAQSKGGATFILAFPLD